MERTYRVTINQLQRAAPIRKTIHEGVRYLEDAMELALKEATIDTEDARERGAELAVTGRTAWSYGFTDVTIEREQQVQPTIAANKES